MDPLLQNGSWCQLFFLSYSQLWGDQLEAWLKENEWSVVEVRSGSSGLPYTDSLGTSFSSNFFLSPTNARGKINFFMNLSRHSHCFVNSYLVFLN